MLDLGMPTMQLGSVMRMIRELVDRLWEERLVISAVLSVGVASLLISLALFGFLDPAPIPEPVRVTP